MSGRLSGHLIVSLDERDAASCCEAAPFVFRCFHSASRELTSRLDRPLFNRLYTATQKHLYNTEFVESRVLDMNSV